MDYDKYLDEQFKDRVINLVRHDTSPTGCPAYIEAHLGKKPKDMGETAKDLSNYIYRRFGLRYQSMPEYRGKGKKMTIRWFMTWDDVRPILPNIFKAVASGVQQYKGQDHFPFAFHSLIIQNTSRGVQPRQQEVA